MEKVARAEATANAIAMRRRICVLTRPRLEHWHPQLASASAFVVGGVIAFAIGSWPLTSFPPSIPPLSRCGLFGSPLHVLPLHLPASLFFAKIARVHTAFNHWKLRTDLTTYKVQRVKSACRFKNFIQDGHPMVPSLDESQELG